MSARFRPFIPAVLVCLVCVAWPVERTEAAVDFSEPEPGEHLPGGAATSLKTPDRHAFSRPSANMGLERKLDFKVGNGLFKRLWVTAPSSTQAADGLGPLYNARACQRCHLNNGRGRPPEPGQDQDLSQSLVLHLSVATSAERTTDGAAPASPIPEPMYGRQLQSFAIPGHPGEGRLEVSYESLPVSLADGTLVELRKPSYRVRDLGYGPMHPDTLTSPRVAPPMIGLGLLELIREEDLMAHADPEDKDGDGISGRPNRVWSAKTRSPALGRFGWKAASPGIDEQNQAAFAHDIGISVPLHPDGAGDCTGSQAACRQAPNGNSPQYADLEAGPRATRAVLLFTRNLAVPARRRADDPQVLAGKRLFHAAGCQACHVPAYVTGRADDRPELSGQHIWPYTDLLLHDMGEGLADGRPEAQANGREWRTPPLWGIGLTGTVSGHTYFLHDGRARNLLEAVLWHGGEAQASRDRVVAMNREQREALLAFLESL